jgi:hypothetical protein
MTAAAVSSVVAKSLFFKAPPPRVLELRNESLLFSPPLKGEGEGGVVFCFCCQRKNEETKNDPLLTSPF